MLKERRPMSDLERARIEALALISWQLGSSYKLMVKDLHTQVRVVPHMGVTEKQAETLAALSWRYRAQLPIDVVPLVNPWAGRRRR